MSEVPVGEDLMTWMSKNNHHEDDTFITESMGIIITQWL
jgi:hypothetical protein